MIKTFPCLLLIILMSVIKINAQIKFTLSKDKYQDILFINALNDSITQTKIEIDKNIKNINLLNKDLDLFVLNKNNSNIIVTYFKNPIKEFIPTNIHKPRFLQLPVENNNNQNTHPDILYIPKGFGPNKYKYWISFTPYPDSDESLENPCLYAGYDGLNWEIPNGLTNPVITKPNGNSDHNADPDILMNADSTELWIYYEQKITNPYAIFLLRTRSKDGISWSVPDTILKTNNSYFISPSVVYDNIDKKYYMWTNNNDTKTNDNFELRESVDGKVWSKPIFCDIKNGTKIFRVWHHDIRKSKDFYEALFTIQSDYLNLYYARSYNRINWVPIKILIPKYDFENGYLYRSTFLPIDSIPGMYHIWYSSWKRTSNKWRISDFYAKIDMNQISYYDAKYKTFLQDSPFENIELEQDQNSYTKIPIKFTLWYKNSKDLNKTDLITYIGEINDNQVALMSFDNEYIYFSFSFNWSLCKIYSYDLKGNTLFNEQITSTDRTIKINKNKLIKNQPSILRILVKSNDTIYCKSYKIINQ